MDHLSCNSLTDADECLKKFHAKRLLLDKPPSVPAGPRDIGVLAHDYIKAFFRGTNYLDELIAQDHTTDHAEAFGIYEKWKRDFNVPEERWFGSEIESRCKVPVLPAHLDLMGYEDFIEIPEDDPSGLDFTDFKTGWGTDMSPGYVFQAHLTLLRYDILYPGKRLRYRCHFVRRNVYSEWITWTPELRKFTIDRVLTLWAKISQATQIYDTPTEKPTIPWPATPGAHCTFCPVKVECAKALRAEVAGTVIANAPAAVEALNSIALMEEAIASLKESLRVYVDANGPVQAGEGKYDYKAEFKQSPPSVSCSDPLAVVNLITPENLGKALKIDTKVKDGARLLNEPSVAEYFKVGKAPKPRFYVGKNKEEKEEAD